MEGVNTVSNRNANWKGAERLRLLAKTPDEVNKVQELFEKHHFSDVELPVHDAVSRYGIPEDLLQLVKEREAVVIAPQIDLHKSQDYHHHFIINDYRLSFKTLKSLDNGSYGHVEQGIYYKNGESLAIKACFRRPTRGKIQMEKHRFVNEFEQLRKFNNHTHVVEYVASFSDRSFHGLIMRPVAEENLSKFLDHATFEDHTWLKQLFGCLAKTFEDIHSLHVIHKDIKPANLLVSNRVVLVADFGISRDWPTETHSNTTGISPCSEMFAAPEVLEGQSKSRPLDVYSLGLVYLHIFVVLRGKRPRYIDEELKKKGKTSTPGRNDKGLQSLLSKLKEDSSPDEKFILGLIKRMVDKKPKNRPDIKEVREKIFEYKSSDVIDTTYCCEDCRSGRLWQLE